VEIVLERAHPVDESGDTSSTVISSDTVIKTLIFQKPDVVMMTVADINLEYAIIGMLIIIHLFKFLCCPVITMTNLVLFYPLWSA